jgi:D-serine deaminase-like pyridoxal phosphate-dependent protein
MHINELDTPAVLIDLDVLERNLQRAADHCHRHKIALRPHIKTHKMTALARMQVAAAPPA